MDVASLPYFLDIFENTNDGGDFHNLSDVCTSYDPLNLEYAPIVQNRSTVLDATQFLYVQDQYGKIPALPGDRVAFRISASCLSSLRDLLDRHSYSYKSSSMVVHISGYVCVSWCVGGKGGRTPTVVHAVEEVPHGIKNTVRFISRHHATSPRSLRPERNIRGSKRRFFSDSRACDGIVDTGDICTLMRPCKTFQDDTLICVIISRFRRNRRGIPSQVVVWIDGSEVQEQRSDGSWQPNIVEDMPLLETPVKLKNDSSVLFQNFVQRKRNKGVLQDSRPYVVYRIMLYCDDFKESASPYSQNSAGGVYLLPMGMSQKARNNSTAVHIVSLTPAGVSTNEILLDIIPDIVKGTTEGVTGKTPDGQDVVIFLDVIGYIADYPAAVAPLDIIGQSGDAPCTHCNIRKFKESSTGGLCYTTKIHSRNSSALSCSERNSALREDQIPDADANVLGMKPSSYLNDRSCPLLVLQKNLQRAQHLICVDSEGQKVVPGTFDSFRSSLIAPDHLLTGVARNVIDVVFRLLPSSMRKEADVAICAALENNGLIRERSMFNHKKCQLHSMSLSSVYCVLSVTSFVLIDFNVTGCANSEAYNAARQLLQHLQKLIAMTHWNPNKVKDGVEAYNLVRVEERRP